MTAPQRRCRSHEKAILAVASFAGDMVDGYIFCSKLMHSQMRPPDTWYDLNTPEAWLIISTIDNCQSVGFNSSLSTCWCDNLPHFQHHTFMVKVVQSSFLHICFIRRFYPPFDLLKNENWWYSTPYLPRFGVEVYQGIKTGRPRPSFFHAYACSNKTYSSQKILCFNKFT